VDNKPLIASPLQNGDHDGLIGGGELHRDTPLVPEPNFRTNSRSAGQDAVSYNGVAFLADISEDAIAFHPLASGYPPFPLLVYALYSVDLTPVCPLSFTHFRTFPWTSPNGL